MSAFQNAAQSITDLRRLTLSQSNFLVGAATQAYCPEFLSGSSQ